jgi:hypothetical protein
MSAPLSRDLSTAAEGDDFQRSPSLLPGREKAAGTEELSHLVKELAQDLGGLIKRGHVDRAPTRPADKDVHESA